MTMTPQDRTPIMEFRLFVECGDARVQMQGPFHIIPGIGDTLNLWDLSVTAPNEETQINKYRVVGRDIQNPLTVTLEVELVEVFVAPGRGSQHE